jgi:aerobic-type carbon monoxide dehydrogenase small subunit (CoxS/CutS family)
VQVSDRVEFTCNGDLVVVDVEPGETLLSVLRERLGLTSAKDGCAPQGQCGCCTVLVDGDARVACVTPVERIAERSVTTLEGLDAAVCEPLAAAFVATGGSQCGFCTPGIIMRAVASRAKGKTTRVDFDRALAAHLCRCTGWQTVYDALEKPSTPTRDRVQATARAELEGGNRQVVAGAVPLGHGGFADDSAPRVGLVAVPLPPGSDAQFVEAAGIRWVVGESLADARARAGKVQGRRTTAEVRPPLALPPRPAGGVRLATSWVEPAYLEPDASWCAPGGDPASPLGNGGAFGGKIDSPVAPAARELADRYGETVRTLFSREDVVRIGPKRPPIAASCVLRDGERLVIEGRSLGARPVLSTVVPFELDIQWQVASSSGLRASPVLRASGLAELTVLVHGALAAAGHTTTEPLGSELHDNVVRAESGAAAAAAVSIDDTTGAIERVGITVAAGDPLDEVALRSYAIGAAHMALGWVLTEGLAVDPETGEVHDLTIRSFGIIRPKDVPPIDVTIVDAAGPPLAAGSDAVFAAVAAATWNALARAEGERPETFPALGTRASRMLRR